jgi:16S rRNA (cytosine967-C5)-methyltransferase
VRALVALVLASGRFAGRGAHAAGEITPERLWRVWAAYWITNGRDLPKDETAPEVKPGDILKRAKEGASPAIRAAIPDWLEERGSRELGTAWPALRESLNQPADVFMRVNTLKNDRRALRERLGQEGFETEAVDQCRAPCV